MTCKRGYNINIKSKYEGETKMANTTTTTSKILRLNGEQRTVKGIARRLGIRYQFVWNVLNKNS